MWIPNSIVALIVFAAICTLTKKAWLKYQAKKQIISQNKLYHGKEEN